MPMSVKIAKADIVVDNSDSKEWLEKKIAKLMVPEILR